jgi:hypothetical protein
LNRKIAACALLFFAAALGGPEPEPASLAEPEPEPQLLTGVGGPVAAGITISATYGHGQASVVSSITTQSINIAAGTTVLVFGALNGANANNPCFSGVTGSPSGASFTQYTSAYETTNGAVWYYHKYTSAASGETIKCNQGGSFSGSYLAVIAVQILRATGSADSTSSLLASATNGAAGGTGGTATTNTFSTGDSPEVVCTGSVVQDLPPMTTTGANQPIIGGQDATFQGFSDGSNSGPAASVACYVFTSVRSSITGAWSWATGVEYQWVIGAAGIY